jgi:hypothetical protein
VSEMPSVLLSTGEGRWLRSAWRGRDKECGSWKGKTPEMMDIMVERFTITFNEVIVSTISYERLFQRKQSGYGADSS